ncbi:hypothetical protein ACFX16_038457 [Malus domestica]
MSKKQVCRNITKPITVLDPWNNGLIDARSDIPEIDRKKYHVPGNMTLGEFILFIRGQYQDKQEKADICLFQEH